MKFLKTLAIYAGMLLHTVASGETLFQAIAEDGSKIEVTSQLQPISINQIHSWQIKLLDARDEPIQAAEISVSGGMPLHDHGLPTLPQVTEEISQGVYLLQGVRFHMPGLWQIDIKLQSGSSEENFSFNLTL